VKGPAQEGMSRLRRFGPLALMRDAVLPALLLWVALEPSPAAGGFTHIVSVAQDRPLELTVLLPRGQVEVFHGAEERVTIAITGQARGGEALDERLIAASLSIEQVGNNLRLGYSAVPELEAAHAQLSYRIDVPHWSQVRAVVDAGTLTILGVMGPVNAFVRSGVIRASYVSKELSAETESGDLAIEAVGGRVDARAIRGNISCARVARGASVVTGDGDIDLTSIGPSKALVRKGSGKIDVIGADGSLKAATDAGDLRVRAVPRNNWELESESGNIRVHFPRAARFDIDAATDSGEILIRREDIGRSPASVRHVLQKANGGGPRIEVHTATGRITIQ
jgi:hypothetical protein